MKHQLIPIACIFAIMATAAGAQTPQASTKVPTPPAAIGVPPPTPEALRLAAQISDYATAQCAGKDAAASDCRIKNLWVATQCPDQVTAQSTDAKTETARCKVAEGGFEYEVASIKPHKDDGNNGSMVGGMSDGYRAVNVTMQNTVLNAYSTGLKLEITGGPGWMNDARYDIEAKFVPEVGDALRKLTPDDRRFVRGYMMQQVLKERMNFVAHVETKEVPAYDLVVGKNGLKIKAADPNAKDNGTMMMRMDQGKMVLNAKGIPLSNLAANLSGPAGRPVFDKTALAGTYDITLEYAPERALSASAPDGGPTGGASALPADPVGPSVMAALEDQLGLKLVPSRGPMQIVVIERIAKPDAN
jgi:uncharacterized protein (TIGR03435 family)